MLDPNVTTPLRASMAAAAREPLAEPTFPNRLFPALPGYDYQESLPARWAPDGEPARHQEEPARATRRRDRGLVLFENEGLPVFTSSDAIAQWIGLMRSLAYDAVPTIRACPLP